MLKTLRPYAAVFALALASPAFTMPMASGVLDGTEPTFENPATTVTTITSYDLVEFFVDTDGLYTFDAFYPGDTAADENLDGYLLLYANMFNPAATTDAATE